MDLKIGKNLKNKIMQNKTMQNIVHRKSNLAKKEHNIKRNSLFSKIRSKVSDFRKKIKKSFSPQEMGETVAEIIMPITNNMECLEGIKTEADFKKGFFKSLCGDKLPESEQDPAAFFARHPELSIRKEVLHDNDIQNMVGLFEDATKPEIKTAFINKFSKTVKDSADNDIPQGELLTRYIKDIDDAIKEKNNREVKFVPTKETSPQAQAIFEKLQKLKEDTQKVKLDIDIVEKKFDSLKFDARRLNTIKQKLESKKTPLDKVSALATEQLNNIINNLSGSVDFIKKSTQETATDISTLHKTINETLQKADKDFENSMKKCDDFMSSEHYQKITQSTKDIIAEHINSLEILEKKQPSLLQLAKTAEDFAEKEFNQDTTNNNAKIRYEKAKEDYTKINAHKTEIENRLKELRLRQAELQTLSQEEALKQHIIAGSEKLADIFDASQEPVTPQTFIDAFHENLDEALNNILDDAGKTLDDAGKTQALQNAVNAIQDTLPPLAFLGLMLGLDNYKNQIDTSIFKNNNIETFIAQRINLQQHLKNSSHTINLDTLPNGETYTLFASNGTHHQAINITKTEDITKKQKNIKISTHDFHDATKNAGTYTLNASQIPDAKNYLNEILKKEKTTYPNFSDINATLDKFTKEYKTDPDTPLSKEIIDKIHFNLYENDSIIETHWIVSDDPADAGRKAIDEKFSNLFPTKEIYDDFYTKVQLDGQPLTTLAMQYLAYKKWGNLEQDNILALETLHAGMRRLSKPNNNAENHIKLDEIFQKDGDAILLDFNNHPTTREAGKAHYTGALIRKNANDNYTIITINTLNKDENGNERKHDNEYRLTNPPKNIKNIIQQIYAKSTRGKNSEEKLRDTQIQKIENILKDSPEKTKEDIKNILTGSHPKTKIEDIKNILGNTFSEEGIQEIKTILDDKLPETKIEDIENILNAAGITPTQTKEQTQQTGLRCGIEMVNRAINYLPQLAEANIKRKEILSNTHNKFEMTIEENSNNITVPPKFIFDRYINPLIETDSTSSTEEIKKIFKCTESQKALFGSDVDCDTNYINTYIASYQKTNPITAIALLDYQDAEKYKPLMESMQAGSRVQNKLFSDDRTSIDMLFSDKPTSFIFKTDDANHTIMTIIPQADNKHEIIFVNSQTPNKQEIFTIAEDKKEDAKNFVKNLTNYSERLMFDRDNPNTFPPNARPNLTRLKENNYLTHKGDISLDEGTSYLDNINNYINNYIKGKQTS